MPLYNSPAIPPQLLQKGVPAYLLGGLNMLRGDATGTVADTALAANVATITVQLNQGATPLVGDFITVWGTTQQAGLFNATRAVITAVSITPATGAGTISFALTGSNQSTTADTGQWRMEIGETSEAITNNSFSAPVLVQAPEGDSQFTLPFAVRFPTLPTGCTVSLQAAVRDIASEYVTILTCAVVAASAQTMGPFGQATLQRGYFYRFAVTGLGGTGTIIAKIG